MPFLGRTLGRGPTKICGWKLPQMNMLLVVFSNGAIKEETMYQDFDDGNGSYDDG